MTGRARGTVGNVKVAGKSVEKILLAICKQATEQRQEALEVLEQSVPQLERCLVHEGTPLIYEYHSKVLGRLATLLNLYGQAQASGSDLMLSNRL